jgi:hypothetical protein
VYLKVRGVKKPEKKLLVFFEIPIASLLIINLS